MDNSTSQNSNPLRALVVPLAGTGVAVAMNIANQKYGTLVPDWTILAIILVSAGLWLYWIWTHPTVKKSRRLVYSYPRMSLLIMIIVGACSGAGLGALIWWSVYRQPIAAAQVPRATTSPHLSEAVPLSVNASKPNLVPVGFERVHITYDVVTKTFKVADTGIPTVAVRFRNSHTDEREIAEADEIRAHIYYEPIEFYKNLDRNIPGFASVDNGVWLNEPDSVVHFKRGETKTLVLAVNLGDNMFGAFDHQIETKDGVERLFPRVPKITADKYLVKVQIAGGSHGEVTPHLYHFYVTLRPEFGISAN